MSKATAAAIDLNEMAMKSVFKTIIGTCNMTTLVPSLACVSFDKDHHDEIIKCVEMLNNAKSKEDLEAAYGIYFTIGITAGAPIHEIMNAINSRTAINRKFNFETKNWLESVMAESMAEFEHPEDDEEEPAKAEEAKPAKAVKAEPKKPEQKPAAKPVDDGSKPADDEEEHAKAEEAKPAKAVKAEPKKPAAPVAASAHSMFQQPKVPQSSIPATLGFNINKFVKNPVPVRPVAAPVVKPQQPVQEPAVATAEPAKDQSPKKDEEPKMTFDEKVDKMNKHFHLIKGTHPGFTESQIDSLLLLINNGFVKKKMREYKSKDRINNPQFYEIPLSNYETDENKGKFDICFRMNSKDKKHPIIILYSTKAKWVEKIKANINDMEMFKA